jgi:hypothetical protein
MFSSMVNPGAGVNMHFKAAQVTGITNAMIHADGVPFFPTVYPLLMKQLEGCVIVAHNASFDERLIMQSCDGQLLPPVQPWLCSWRDLSQRMLSLPSHKLVDVCAHYGISITSAHRASGDVEALAKAMPHLIADAERLHGIRTWGDLQKFLQKPSKTPSPSAVGRAAGGVAIDAAAPCGQHPWDTVHSSQAAAAALPIVAAAAPSRPAAPAFDINLINNAKDVRLPKPYDAAAPCGQHPWDTRLRKWNGNLCVICPL